MRKKKEQTKKKPVLYFLAILTMFYASNNFCPFTKFNSFQLTFLSGFPIVLKLICMHACMHGCMCAKLTYTLKYKPHLVFVLWSLRLFILFFISFLFFFFLFFTSIHNVNTFRVYFHVCESECCVVFVPKKNWYSNGGICNNLK